MKKKVLILTIVYLVMIYLFLEIIVRDISKVAIPHIRHLYIELFSLILFSMGSGFVLNEILNLKLKDKLNKDI